MKIKNKNNVKIIRFILMICFVFLLIMALISSLQTLKVIMAFLGFIAFFTAIFLPNYEFDCSDEYLLFGKYGIFKTNYIHPFIEIPVTYITDYEVKKKLMLYLVKITVEDDFSPNKNIVKIPLQFFSEYQIIKIIKTLEAIKNKNIHAKVKF